MPRRRRRDEWARLVEEWKASGSSADDFAKIHDLNARTLTWWSAQLKPGSSYWKRMNKRDRSVARAKSVQVRQQQSPAPLSTEVERVAPSDPKGEDPLTVRVVELLVREPDLTARAQALSLGNGIREVLSELRELEMLGLVARKGKGLNARWRAL